MEAARASYTLGLVVTTIVILRERKGKVVDSERTVRTINYNIQSWLTICSTFHSLDIDLK